MAHAEPLLQEPTGNARDYVHDVVTRSGSSFTWGMRLLPRPRREAMYAIYAFCREVDDVADGPGTREQKMAELAEWRVEIDRLYAGTPSRPTARALLPYVELFELPKEEFLALIDGMEMDARRTMVAPSREEFELYCRRVAGAVGVLSMHAFGAREPAAMEIAVVLGEGLQITNILRDLDEDAAEGRLYLPQDLLEAAGIDAGEPGAVLSHPGLPRVCEALARMAWERFQRTRVLLRDCHRRALRPCILMMEVYVRVLERLERRGWSPPREPVRVSRPEKLWIALRHGLFG